MRKMRGLVGVFKITRMKFDYCEIACEGEYDNQVVTPTPEEFQPDESLYNPDQDPLMSQSAKPISNISNDRSSLGS